MGRPKTVGKGLPKYLARDRDGYYGYHRPDKRTKVSLGRDGDHAVRMAQTLNAAFDAERTGLSREARIQLFRSYDWLAINEQDHIYLTHKFRDIMPLLKERQYHERIRNTWAYEKGKDRRYKNRNGIKYGLDADNPPRWIIDLHRQCEKNARARGIEFALRLVDVCELTRVSKGRCVVTNIRLCHDRVEGNRIKRPYAPSIDRVDSSKGYSLENCRLVCVAANMAMSQWGEEVLLELAKSIARKRISR